MFGNSHHFEKILRENLARFTAPPDQTNIELFQVHHEISIARYALTCQAQAYHKAVEVFSLLLEQQSEQLLENPNLLTQILTNLSQIEMKSKALIESVQKVTGILGQAVNIDIDKASLASVLVRLPTLISNAITNISHDPELADRISTSVSVQLDDVIRKIRFEPNELLGTPNNSGTNGIDLNQFAALVNTVPTGDYHEAN